MNGEFYQNQSAQAQSISVTPTHESGGFDGLLLGGIFVLSVAIASLKDLIQSASDRKAARAKSAILKALELTRKKNMGISETILVNMCEDCFGYSWVETRLALQKLEAEGKLRLEAIENNVLWVS